MPVKTETKSKPSVSERVRVIRSQDALSPLHYRSKPGRTYRVMSDGTIIFSG